MQMPLFQTPHWSVSELTSYLRDILESDSNLQDIWVQGEVSNFSRPSSGHLYFTLKDSKSALMCVMWRSAAGRLSALPRDGEAVEVHGGLNIYEASGQYQLYADMIRPAGEGALYQEFLRLKALLEAEGLFDPQRKRPIPRWPQRIGIVTSPTGAALRDMLNTLRRRYPLVEVILAPSPVQGVEAPPGIIHALRALNGLQPPVDLIIVGRGGGSIEDLWAFNDESVARAIAASQAPVISGVGHETDFTIADFVGDLRAPTPTAAAELATPNRVDLLTDLNGLQQRLGRAIGSALQEQRWQINRLQNRLAPHTPEGRIRSDRQRLDEFNRRAATSLQHHLLIQRAHLQGVEQRLAALNPLAVLQRGYAILSQADGSPLRSVNQAQIGHRLHARLHDGQFDVQVSSSPSAMDD